MKTTTFTALAASLLWCQSSVAMPTTSTSTSEQAPEVARRAGGSSSPKVVGVSTQRRTVEDPIQRDRIRRRAGTVRASLDNQETLYFVNMSIGTPAQNLRLHLDTGSSDLWVNTPSSRLCLQRSQPCRYAGTYTANSSSTYRYVGSYFNISYVDGSSAGGDYVSDVVAVGGASLSRLQFGVGYTSSSAQSILGIGYELNEVQVGRAGLAAYRNLPSQMVADGLISSNAYSLWLNDLDASTGSILFGGVDTEQYVGSLRTLPVQQNGGQYAEFLITLTALRMNGTAVGEGMALAVLLDSGSSLTYLPDAMVETIYSAVGAQYDSQEGAAYVPCALASQDTSLTFAFSEPAAISVPMNELVLDLVTSSGRRPTFRDGVPACLFGLAKAGSGTNVLGDTFLRSAYVVYDLANNAISLAPTNFNATRSNVVEIGTGASPVPDAVAVANPVAATVGISLSNGIGASSAAAAPPGGAGGPVALGFLCAVAGFAAGFLMLV